MASLVKVGSNQTCPLLQANTRLYVEESIAPVFLEHLKGHFAGWTQKQGDPSNIETLLGTVADAAQLASVSGFVKEAKESGATLAIGGDHDGAYVKPTIFTNVKDTDRINVQEVFGPVMVYHTFKDEEEVLKRANASDYGLYASVSFARGRVPRNARYS